MRIVNHRCLWQLQQTGLSVAVYLKSGARLQGKIVQFDSQVILLQGVNTIMVYQQAILSLQPIIMDHLPDSP